MTVGVFPPATGGGAVATDTIWDAKGDLAGGTGLDTAARLAVGANDTILMADSAAATGLKWVAPAGGAAPVATDGIGTGGTADTFTRGDHAHPISIANQATQEAGTSQTDAVYTGYQKFHPSATKFWVKAGVTGNVLASYNVTSLTDTGTGALTITIATDFSTADWSCVGTIGLASTTLAQSCTYDSMAAGTVVMRSVVEAGSAADPVTWSVQGMGDQ